MLLAVLGAGCGAASTSQSSGGTSTAASTTAASTPAQTSTATPAPQTIPPGFARYRARGFTFVAPAGMKPAPNGGIPGLPRGASAETLTPGGRRLENTNVQIIEGTNPRLRTDVTLDEVATSLETSDARDRALKGLHTNISTMTVNGAESVRIVTESYTAPAGHRTRTLFHRTWLMVLPRPGLLIDLVVVDEPQHGGRLNPATVLDSFRLDRAGY
jgi:hypothetical protein